MSQVLYIMQGASGSGKSTLAKKLGGKVFSTDEFFMVDGQYVFVGSKLTEYHKKNLDRSIEAMKQGETVVVDNTNIKRWQCREYVRHAVDNGIPVVFVRVVGEFQNTHGVPGDVVAKMRSEMETLDVASVLTAKAPWEK